MCFQSTGNFLVPTVKFKTRELIAKVCTKSHKAECSYSAGRMEARPHRTRFAAEDKGWRYIPFQIGSETSAGGSMDPCHWRGLDACKMSKIFTGIISAIYFDTCLILFANASQHDSLMPVDAAPVSIGCLEQKKVCA